MRRVTRLLCCGLLGPAMLLSGCASIVSGTKDSVTFNSNPEEATVLLNGTAMGKTPLTLRLKKKTGQTLAFEKEGYDPVTLKMDTRLNPWFWGNILLGGMLGSTTDAASGAIYKYAPNQYMVTLPPSASARLETHTAISADQERKDYIVRNYQVLLKDLQDGGGEHLTALLALLDVPDDQSEGATRRLRALSEAYPDIVDFANHVVEAFGG